jgi:colanic acid biosynthesis glycosyl transferase WcaI
MRILMVSQWFTPEVNLVFPLAKSLAAQGHQVQVLTGFPNYPTGKIFPGYKLRPWKRERMGNIDVLRVVLYPSHDRSTLRRMINYISFGLSAAIIGVLLAKTPDVVYVYHPTPTSSWPALLLKLFRKVPFVYHVQDLWPESVVQSGMFNSKVAHWFIQKWCRFVYRCASRIAVISPGFKEVLLSNNVPEDKIRVIYNWCDDNNMYQENRDGALAKELGMSNKFNVVFAGTMGVGQGLDAALDAAKILSDSCPNAQLVFIGGGTEKERLIQKRDAMGLKNVIFLLWRSPSQMSSILALADVLFVHLKDNPLYGITIPGKTQAYLQAAKPILMGVKGDAARLVEEAQAGITCCPEDPESIAKSVLRLYEMPREILCQMGKNGQEFYKNNLALDVAAKKFESILSQAI